MGYTPTNWQPGDIVSSERLNKIEQGIVEQSEKIEDIKSKADDVPLIKEKLTLVKSANVYNKATAEGGYLDSSGAVVADSGSMVSDYIPVTAGNVVKTYYMSGSNVYAANMGTVCGYNASKEFVSGTRSTYVNTLTVPSGVSYLRFNVSNGMVDTYMMIVDGEQPTAYIPYANWYVATSAFIDDAISIYDFADRPISKEETDFWEEEKSINLYNVEDVVLNEYFNSNGTTQSNPNVARAFVALDGAGTYTFNVDGAFFGLSNALKIPCFDKNKNYVKYITATTEDTIAAVENLCSLVVSESDIADGVVYIGFTMAITYYENEMVVKGDTYPESFIPYYQYWTIPDLVSVSQNPLFGKQIIFDGDSICSGTGSAMGDYGNGYAGRIGVDYGANAVNVGVSGACITAETYFDGGSARHWVSRYIDTIHTNYPDADYIIAEGGTNDADNFYGDDSKLGTFDETDFTGPFDDTTFYGAMDSWCKKALTYYPKKKIGFIVAHKMGTGFVTYVKNRYDYFTYASKVCKKWGIPVLNLWDDGQLRPDVTSMYDPQYNTIETATEHGLPYYDGQHLTAYGYDVISPKIAEWMKTL